MKYTRLLKRTLQASLLLLIAAVLFFLWLVTTESGLHWLYARALPYLPADVTVEKLQGRLIGPITISGLNLQQDNVHLQADRLNLHWQPSRLLVGHIDVQQFHVDSLNIRLTPTTSATSTPSSEPFTLPVVKLPWRMTLKGVMFNEVQWQQGEMAMQFEQIALDAGVLFSRINITQLFVRMDNLAITLSGKLNLEKNYQHDLDLNWRLTLPTAAQPVLIGQGKLEGDLAATRLQQQVSGPLQMNMQADLQDLPGRLNWQVQMEVSELNPANLDSGWPALQAGMQLQGEGNIETARVQGRLDGDYPPHGPITGEFRLRREADNQFHIEQFAVQLPQTEARLQAQGDWKPGEHGGRLALDLDWQNLRWPLQGTAWFDSEKGQGHIEGNLQQYRLQLTTTRPWPQVPESTWQIQATGDLDGLNVEQLAIKVLDGDALNGEALVEGQLKWSPMLSWQAEAEIRNIDPARLLPDWPGQLDARLNSQGRYESGQWVVDAKIKQLKGRLRDYPVSLQADLKWNRDALIIDHFDLQSASTHLNVKGKADTELNLSWSIDSNNLLELYPQTAGQLQASGHLSGSRQSPFVQARVQGKALKFLDYAADSIDGEMAIDVHQWQRTRLDLSVDRLRMGDFHLPKLRMDINEQTMQLHAVSEKASFDVKLKGKAQGQSWQGLILKAEILSNEFENWTLNQPASLSFATDTFELETLCLHNPASRLCFDLHQQNNHWQASIDAKQLSLKLLSPWLPPELKFEGAADAMTTLEYDAADGISGMLDLKLDPGKIQYPLLKEGQPYRGAEAHVILNDEGLQAKLDIALSGKDTVQGQLRLAGFNPLSLDSQTQSLQGNVQISLQELTFIEALFPEIQDLQAEINVDLDLAGTLAAPEMIGQANMQKASLHIPRLGLNLERISLNAQSDRKHNLHYHLEVLSGEGQLTVQGSTQLDRKVGLTGELTIRGENFEVASIPETRMTASPDLQIKYREGRIDVNGSVHIPDARIRTKEIDTAVHVSDDVVIVGRDQPVEKKWAIHSRVRLILGERIRYFGFGFDGRLGGNILLEDEPGQPTRATGEINVVEGRYTAYGQNLTIEHGRLLFTRSPVTNPGLDIRAIRRIGNVTAGVKVNGTLKQPEIELFSIPSMGQTDVLAYLILGRPLETASDTESNMMAQVALALTLGTGDRLARSLGDQFGLDEMRIESSETGDQASLAIGRYLSPRLYVGYGVGLIESFNTFYIRYKISERWQLKAESGEYQGADLLFTIER